MGWGQLVKLTNHAGQRIVTSVDSARCMQHAGKWAELSLDPGATTENYVESDDSGACYFKYSHYNIKVVLPYGDGSGSDTIGYFGNPRDLMPTLMKIKSHTELGLMLVATDVHMSEKGYLVVSLTAQGCPRNAAGPSTVTVDGGPDAPD